MINDLVIELNNYLQEQFSYKTPAARRSFSNKINAYRAKFDLHFRYRPFNEDTLVIARMFFTEERKGHGTRLLNFLCSIAAEHNIKDIILECPNENATEFGKALGFTTLSNENLSISIEDLFLNLKKSK
jgi:GNAT superfamily N-acetyltransferase